MSTLKVELKVTIDADLDVDGSGEYMAVDVVLVEPEEVSAKDIVMVLACALWDEGKRAVDNNVPKKEVAEKLSELIKAICESEEGKE